ncbi:MAG: hypothetical protein LH650_05890, partial [Chloroflexi bacterium]|nr:hypothetical protein [Chloroflexota bacterium]
MSDTGSADLSTAWDVAQEHLPGGWRQAARRRDWTLGNGPTTGSGSPSVRMREVGPGHARIVRP